MSKRFYLSAISCLFLTSLLFSQGTRLLRQPTISSKHIVFVYADDLWLVDREGGDAKRLTSHEGTESFPHFSPDGSKVAFSAQYDGNTDVFVVNTEGGEPKRLTYHPSDDIVQGWTPDGKQVLFRSSRAGVPTMINHFYTIDTEGGNETKMPIPQASFGDISEDGNYVAYTPITLWDPEWRNYRGGQAQPIWIMNLKDKSLTQTPQTDKERHLDPVWYKGDIYFLSERDYANNVWKYNPTTKNLKQISFHKDFDCKSIDACGDRIVYEQAGYLHLYDPSVNKAKQLIINVKGDFNWARPRWKDVPVGDLVNASLSPTGQRAMFEYRGDIFTVPKENGDGRNITNTSGVADRSPTWSPDGKKIAWFSDASGEYQLMIADQMGMEKPQVITFAKPTFFFKPTWSPDGKYISFSDTDYTIWIVDVKAGTTKKVDTDRMAHPNRTMNPSFSTDSKWIAYVKILENQFKAVFLYNIETGQKTQITDGLADAIDPVWDATGKYLYFLASTDYGVSSGWLDMSSYDLQVTRGLYVVVLNKKDPSPLMPKSDEEEVKNEDKDKKDSKDSLKITTIIDLDGIGQRILAVNIPLRNYTSLMAAPKDYVFYAENIPNQQGVTLHRYNFKDRKSEVFLTPINAVSTSHDRKQLLYQSKDTWGIVKTEAIPKMGDGKLTIDLKMKIVPQEEWAQILKEGWRYMRDFLYVDNVHGAPWKQVYDWYSPWLEHCRHRTDLNYVVDILSGEVSIGHSYVSGGDFPDVKKVSIGLLGADIAVENSGFRIKKIYTGESWNPELKAPLAVPGVDVKVGDYVVAVNGTPLSISNNFYSYFENKADKQVKLKVNNAPNTEGGRLVTVVPIADEGALRSRDWVESNRRKVDSLSKGQLAYVYIPNTGRPGYNYFNRYYFSQMDKKGAVIDERNNGGGSAADYIVDVMARQLQGYFNSRVEGHKPFTVPNGGIWGPKVMIINERAGSGGDLMPYLFRQQKVGPLVGVRTWGGLVGTWDTPPFIDKGRMVAPRGGYYDLTGKWSIEGEGISPDIEVQQTPAEVLRGNDPQLERAVQEAMNLMKTQGVQLKPEPAAPIRYKRPKQG